MPAATLMAAPGDDAAPDGSAQQAWQLGERAFALGDFAHARRWLDRAGRLTPDDPALALTRATVLLRMDDPACHDLFAALAAAHDVREVWLGLAAARRLLGDPAGAAQALAQALSRHALPRPVPAGSTGGDQAAERIAAEAGASGWCGLHGGRLVLRPLQAGARVSVTLDGQPLQARSVTANQTGLLRVTLGGRDLLGSPIDLAAIRRVAGFVEEAAGGIRGWAWHPGDPQRDPVLTLAVEGAPPWTLRATRDGVPPRGTLFARPRGFAVPRADLARRPGLLHVTGTDRHDLCGSPLDPGAEIAGAVQAAHLVAALFRPDAAPMPWPQRTAMPADIRGRPAQAAARPRGVAVIVPLLRGGRPDFAGLNVPANVPVWLVLDDPAATPLPASPPGTRILRLPRPAGLAGCINAGLRAAAGRDVVILHPQARPPPDAIDRLADATRAAPDIGSAAGLASWVEEEEARHLRYPNPSVPGPDPGAAPGARWAGLARQANADTTVELALTGGPCLFLRRDCIDAAGFLRTEPFAQGPGALADFSVRARHLGWRHVALPGLFVPVADQPAPSPEAAALIERNHRVLRRLHPGLDNLLATDPMAAARRKLDAARWRDGRAARPRAAILVTHDRHGGVERQVAARAEALRAQDLRPILLRPARTATGGAACLVSESVAAAFPGLYFAVPDELPALARLLRGDRPAWLEIHHLLGHAHAVLGLARLLAIPHEVHAHDYAWFCPRIALVGPQRRYCGEPEAAARCEECLADAGRVIEDPIPVADLRRRSAADLGTARRVVVAARDVAARLQRHFPALRAEVTPWEDAAPAPAGLAHLAAPSPERPRLVCVIGAIGIEKGYDVLLACARDAAARALPLRFVLVGHSIDDGRLIATGRVFVTGRFAPDEAVALVRAQRADLAFIPSIWPETWCFALSHAWQAGLDVAAFDIGAPAERIRAVGRGWLLRPGLPAAGVTDTLLGAGTAILPGASCPAEAMPA